MNESVNERLARLVLRPTTQRESFCRIRRVDESKRMVDRLDQKDRWPNCAWSADWVDKRDVCMPDMASKKGDIATGTFEII